MRFMIRLSIPPAKFNQAVHDGTAGAKIAKILDELKPEAVYFAADGGKRGGVIVADLKNASEIPKYAEPWFLYFDADVEFIPIMSPEDLQKAGIEKLGKKWK